MYIYGHTCTARRYGSFQQSLLAANVTDTIAPLATITLDHQFAPGYFSSLLL